MPRRPRIHLPGVPQGIKGSPVSLIWLHPTSLVKPSPWSTLSPTLPAGPAERQETTGRLGTVCLAAAVCPGATDTEGRQTNGDWRRAPGRTDHPGTRVCRKTAADPEGTADRL